jgi:hypothetical protein
MEGFQKLAKVTFEEARIFIRPSSDFNFISISAFPSTPTLYEQSSLGESAF